MTITFTLIANSEHENDIIYDLKNNLSGYAKELFYSQTIGSDVTKFYFLATTSLQYKDFFLYMKLTYNAEYKMEKTPKRKNTLNTYFFDIT
ncbi:hypothetical protein HK27_07380 [Acetobacter orientalis]|uniref:hypothetical protein n=1 Tax=Acetobacter orientalis TaxID=146474 RepID=UPI000A3A0990|nr:hypothetical protein [Acetobacter orientalis]OUJ15661.1 hypothetical protein HK27_07380 [Acetobacter orientalis]